MIRNPEPDARSPFWNLPIGGMTPLTTIDFPGHLATVLYTQGCPWRCAYCYNATLQPFAPADTTITPDELEAFLSCRRGLLDGVVFSGGEPTCHAELGAAMQWVRDREYKVALHTTGMYPDRLRAVLPLCDWVAMDVKAPPEAYGRVTRAWGRSGEIVDSIREVLSSGVDCEFRTTVDPELLSADDVVEIARMLHGLGAERYAIQTCQRRQENTPTLHPEEGSARLVNGALRRRIEALFPSLIVR